MLAPARQWNDVIDLAMGPRDRLMAVRAHEVRPAPQPDGELGGLLSFSAVHFPSRFDPAPVSVLARRPERHRRPRADDAQVSGALDHVLDAT